MLDEAALKKDIGLSIEEKEIKINKVRQMFLLQHKLNELIKTDWHTDERMDFQRASMVELVELMDHFGYKWWKKQDPDLPQCELEVVDIAHFLISDLLQTDLRAGDTIHNSVDRFLTEVEFGEIHEQDTNGEAVRALIDNCVAKAAAKDLRPVALGILMNVFNISFSDLSNKYILKNTLNIFRNLNGYNEGTYIKNWNGKEDNEVLMELSEKLDPDSPTYSDDLYLMLEGEYKKL